LRPRAGLVQTSRRRRSICRSRLEDNGQIDRLPP